jgi:prevent-host-death family protein
MTREVPVTQAREELAELINRVAYGRERIVLTRHSKPVAGIVPAEDRAWLEQQGQEVINLSAAESDSGAFRLSSAPSQLPVAARAPGQPQGKRSS